MPPSNQDLRQSKIDEAIAKHPATPFHQLLDDYVAGLPFQFISRFEKLIGISKAEVKAKAEADNPE